MSRLDRMESCKKCSPTPSMSSSWSRRDLRNVAKLPDFNRLYKKVEKAGRRLFNHEKASTFVPSTSSNVQNHVEVPPPYPIDPSFGSAFPPLPGEASTTNPPSYGWALNSIPTGSNTSDLGMLSIDINPGQETAGSGFDYQGSGDYLKPDRNQLMEERKKQLERLNYTRQKVREERSELNMLLNENRDLHNLLVEQYDYLIKLDTNELEREVSRLEEVVAEIRQNNPDCLPIRPPPPKSIRQEGWTCIRCHQDMRSNEFRCKNCALPGHNIDPQEAKICKCVNCM